MRQTCFSSALNEGLFCAKQKAVMRNTFQPNSRLHEAVECVLFNNRPHGLLSRSTPSGGKESFPFGG